MLFHAGQGKQQNIWWCDTKSEQLMTEKVEKGNGLIFECEVLVLKEEKKKQKQKKLRENNRA